MPLAYDLLRARECFEACISAETVSCLHISKKQTPSSTRRSFRMIDEQWQGGAKDEKL
jgi:hypothetical protein